MNNAFLNVSNIAIAYEKQTIVSDISFNLAQGDLACLLGPSGCGKTTILRAISGFQDLHKGEIHLANKLISKKSYTLSPEQRGIGMVFQDHALFPHLSIAQNIGFGIHKKNRSEKNEIVDSLLSLVGLSHLRDQYPHQLSGGQSQRVALARAIAPSPELLLLDEPFSNLDTDLRESLGYEVRSLLKEQGVTAIMVTHDQHDAFALGDKIGVMNEGSLQQWDNSFNLYHAPNTRFVANFIGDGVFIQGTMLNDHTVQTSIGDITGETVSGSHIGRNVDLLIRPDDVQLDQDSTIRGKIIRKAFKGAQTLYTIQTQDNGQLLSLLPSHDNYDIGEMIGVSINADHLVCFASS